MFKNILNSLDKKLLFDRDNILLQNVDEILDLRDSDEFDLEWMRVYNELSKFDISKEEEIEIDKIREKVFILIYEILNDGEIAGEVSDDFEIMCKAYCLEYEDLWLAKMAKIYADKKYHMEFLM